MPLSGGGGGGDAKLYRASYGTFEDYCRERWGMKRAHAYRLIESSAVVGNLSPIGDIPATESQARPLAKLPAEEQAPPCRRRAGVFCVLKCAVRLGHHPGRNDAGIKKSTVGFMCVFWRSKQIKYHSTQADSFQHGNGIKPLQTLVKMRL